MTAAKVQTWIVARWRDVLRLRLWVGAIYLICVSLSLAFSRTSQSLAIVSIATGVAFVVGLVWAATRPNVASSVLSWSVLLNVGLTGLVLGLFELWRADHGWVGYVAAALAYVGFAGMVARFRNRLHARWAGWGLVGLGIIAIYVGLFLLGHVSGIWPLLALGVGAIVLIAGADLSIHGGQNPKSGAAARSASAQPQAQTRLRRPRAGVVVGIAILVALAAAVLLGWLAGSVSFGVVIVAVVALLSLAYVSESPADVVVVLEVLAIFGATRPEAALPPPDHRATPATLLSLGDSYMSGEGAQLFFRGTNEADGNQCRRSPTAYAAQIPQAGLGFTSTVFLACSGAVASEIYDTTQGGTTGSQLGQYNALGSPPAKLVVVEVGGNDAGFSHIGTSCLAPGNCAEKMNDLFLDNLAVVEKNIEGALTAVHTAVPGVPVVAVPYPAPFAAATACDGLLLSGAERSFLSTFLDDLDQEVHQAAAATHTYYLAEMQQSLARANLQLCTPNPTVHHCSDGFSAEHGLNFVHLGSIAGYATQRFNPANWLHDSLHPNACGHDAELAVFKQWYTTNGPSLEPLPTFAAVPAPAGVDPTRATCQLANSPRSDEAVTAQSVTKDAKQVTSCESMANAWALQKVGRAGLYVIALLLVLAISLGWLWQSALRGKQLRLQRRKDIFTGGSMFILALVVVVVSLL